MRSTRNPADRSLRAASYAAAFGAAAVLLNGMGCSATLPAPLAAIGTDESAPRRGGVLDIATLGEPRGFDPATASDELSAVVIRMVFDGLVDYDEKGRIVPVLAERWEAADDGLTYRFFLREGVRFHDGEELTADDVKRTVERALHPTTPGAWTSQFAALAGFEEYTEKNAPHLSGVVVEGRYVVAFRLARRDAVFLPSLALYPLRPVCRTAGERYSPAWAPCGTGPFRLPADGWKRGIRVDLARHDGYFVRDRPYLDGIRLHLAMSPITQRFRFLQGEIDFFRDLTGPDLARLRADARWKPFGDDEPDQQVTGEAMNVEVAPFDNVEVRRAVAAAIDREHYRLLKPGSLTAANQPIPPGVPGHDPALVGQRHDLTAALEHMRRAGYPFDPATGTGGYPREIEYLAYDEGLPRYSAQILQQELAKIGLRVRIKLVSYSAFIALSHRRGRTAILLAGQSADYPDASNFFDSLFASDSIGQEESQNTAFYRNAELDDLLKRAREELDPDARRRMYSDASRIVCDEAPWAFTHYYHYYSVRQPYLRGYRPHAVNVMYMANAWLDRAGVATAQRAAPLLRDALGSLLGARASAR